MPSFRCASSGVHPKGVIDSESGKCPHFEDGVCGLEPTKSCTHRETVFTEREVAVREHVELPPSIKALKKDLQGLDIYELFSDKVHESVKMAMLIISKVNPVGKTKDKQKWVALNDYWNDGEQIECDMGQLSALLAHVGVLHAQLKSDCRSANSALKTFRAQKYNAIKRSFNDHVRKGKFSEKTIEIEIENDSEYQEVQNAMAEASRNEQILDAAMSGIKEHIQVMKKRRETLAMERMESGGPKAFDNR